MTTSLLWPEDPGTRELFGGKAWALRELAGLPVPEWFVVPPPTEPGEDAAGRLDDATVAAIRAALPRLSGELFAVRSSASDEDGGAHSFAGQFGSAIAVPAARVPEEVLAVRRSGFTPRVRAYREEHGLGECSAPAVLVQRLVEAEAAGVAFGIDPVDGSWDRAVVAAVHGLGTALVDGRADADTWHVDRRGAIVARRIADKPVADRWESGELAEEAVPASRREEPALDDATVVAVAELARRCGDRFGRPQDIEWAREEDGVFLLQSRPITTLADLPDPLGSPALWDNSNIAESYGGITTPLTFSFAREVYGVVYRQFCRLVRVSEAVIAANDRTFDGLLGLARGRMVYDLLNWYRLLACFPGYQLNRAFMEQMMGVGESLPAELQDAVVERRRPGRWARLRDAGRFFGTCWGLWRNHRTLDRQVARFRRRLDEALAPPATPYHRQSAAELVASYRRLEEKLLRRWDAPLVNDFLAMIFYGVLRGFCRKWCGDEDGSLQNDLVGGDGTVISAEAARRVRAMAAIARRAPERARALREADVDEAVAAVRADPELSAEYDAYLDEFADRCLEELKLESPTLADEPLSLLRAIGHFAARGDEGPAVDHAGEARRAAEDRARAVLGWRPLRRLIFARVLRHARRCVANRENLRFERTRAFGRVRAIVVELGRRYHAAGILDDPRDVFYCELDEVLGFVEGTVSTPDLGALARARRATFERWRRIPPPADRILTRGSPFLGHDLGERFGGPDHDPSELAADRRKGLGCCPGTARGPARVVRDPRGVELAAGSILVAERTDPGWIMLFPAAAGLVVERGSLLSHSAIVARELGLPCAVSVPGCTGWIADGETIEVDGASGEVRKCAEAGA